MDDKIPVSFEYAGKELSGRLEAVNGAGGSTFFLNVGGYYWGQLIVNEERRAFYNQANDMGHLADYFADVIRAWYQ